GKIVQILPSVSEIAMVRPANGGFVQPGQLDLFAHLATEVLSLGLGLITKTVALVRFSLPRLPRCASIRAEKLRLRTLISGIGCMAIAIAGGSALAQTVAFSRVGQWPGYPRGVWTTALAVSGNYAYVANYDGGLQIIDISDPANPL